MIVGIVTGAITGAAYLHMEEDICISSILLGTLYWFFYGTAFVVGLLEIIAGELETGVTRFIAVSVKTFVLCLGAGFGLMMSLRGKSNDNWFASTKNCGSIDLKEEWWRIPLYLLCCVGVLGQYRLPLRHYWRVMTVMLVAYEVQYQLQLGLAKMHTKDNLDYAASNTMAAIAATITATILSARPGRKRLASSILKGTKAEDESEGCCKGCCIKGCASCYSSLSQCCFECGLKCGLFRDSELASDVLPRLQEVADPSCVDKHSTVLGKHEEQVLLRAIVEEEAWNIWALLMPAVYQLVPGSMIAKLWFNSLFPPSSDQADYEVQNNVFSNLMVISTSLAIGLILGIAICRTVVNLSSCIATKCCCPTSVKIGWKKTSFYRADD